MEKLTDIVGKINADGGEAVGFHLDVTDPPNSVKSFVAQSTEALGDIEVLVAGAGDTYFGKLDEITSDEFDSQLQIHLVGAFRLANAVLPGMMERQRGDLIFVGSDVSLRQRPHMRLRRRQGSAGRDGDQLPDGARGHRCARLDRASRPPHQDLDGLEPACREKLVLHLRIGPSGGQARHDYFLRAADLARAITFVAETPPRGGFIANMELQPEAPLADNKERQKLALGEEGMPS